MLSIFLDRCTDTHINLQYVHRQWITVIHCQYVGDIDCVLIGTDRGIFLFQIDQRFGYSDCKLRQSHYLSYIFYLFIFFAPFTANRQKNAISTFWQLLLCGLSEGSGSNRACLARGVRCATRDRQLSGYVQTDPAAGVSSC